jgi:uncharacterized protein YifE (UPF0438 family)
MTIEVDALTLDDVRLLISCVRALEQLESGARKPKTDAQVHFVLVCRGEQTPQTPYERAYLKWRERRPDLRLLERKLVDINASRSQPREAKRKAEIKKIEQQAAARLALDHAQQPRKLPTRTTPEWGNREDWKRDRGSWRRR